MGRNTKASIGITNIHPPICKSLYISAPMKKLLLGLVSALFIIFVCAEAGAFVVQQINNKYEYWLESDMPIHYTIHRGANDELSLAWIPAITNAFDTWSAASSSTVSFTYDGTTAVSTQANDGENVIIWVTEDGNWSHGSNVAAYTTTYVNASTGRILGFDMEINATPSRTATHPWSASGEAGKMDLQNMITHEVGHVIGLDHVDDPSATMYPTMSLGEINKRSLETDDVNGVSFLYPPQAVVFEMVSGNDQTGTPGTPLSESLIVKVTDGSGTPLSGQFVIFEIITGSGTLIPTAPTTTNAAGLAEAVFTPDSPDKVVVRAVAAGLKEQAFWINNNAPILNWTGEVNYENDGLDPEVGYGNIYFAFKIIYSDADNDPPGGATLWLDMDGDDLFETNEKFNMLRGSSSPYSSGVTYLRWVKIPYSAGSSNVKYYFDFRDRADLPPAGGITSAISPA
ncbi:MAG: matrixin family metalloprotease, partial [Planctomycetota bacterium]